MAKYRDIVIGFRYFVHVDVVAYEIIAADVNCCRMLSQSSELMHPVKLYGCKIYSHLMRQTNASLWEAAIIVVYNCIVVVPNFTLPPVTL